jgi:hypothetical protein
LPPAFPNLWKDLETNRSMADPNPSPSTRFGANEGNSPSNVDRAEDFADL